MDSPVTLYPNRPGKLATTTPKTVQKRGEPLVCVPHDTTLFGAAHKNPTCIYRGGTTLAALRRPARYSSPLRGHRQLSMASFRGTKPPAVRPTFTRVSLHDSIIKLVVHRVNYNTIN
ncbi:unnamed protein product [Heligmosomoides polygyrus]|uniref:Uncharacterized protein n=1 Tax=Heligmosomoides polygyrus TaxID=6339 RepID=A0A183F278_HELPZ|nr:unnamed protein product [Heligmosomoides polygyrus]